MREAALFHIILLFPKDIHFGYCYSIRRMYNSYMKRGRRMNLINRPSGFRTVIGHDASLSTIPDQLRWFHKYRRTKPYKEWHRFECPQCDTEHYLKLRWIQRMQRNGQEVSLCSACKETKRKTDRKEVHDACIALALRKKAMGLIK